MNEPPRQVKLRVLLAQDTFLPLIGGAEIHVANLARHLADRGHQVTVVTASKDDGTSETPDGYVVVRYPQMSTGGRRAMLAALRRLAALVRLVRSHDVVHGHYTFFMSALFGLLKGRRPFVVTLHGLGTLDSSVGSSRLLRAYRWLTFRRAGMVIATSEEMADVGSRFVDGNRLVVIPNGVDLPPLPWTESRNGETGPAAQPARVPKRTREVVTVRRLVPKNGVQYLVEAVPSIVEQVGAVRVTIVGSGPLMSALRARVTELGVTEHVTFTGTLDNADALTVVDRCDVAVFPSSAESTSIAALEAMARAKPIVASAVGGYPEMLGDDERGLLVRLFDRTTSDYEAPPTLPPDRVAALADAVVRVLTDGELAGRLGAAARAWVESTCTWPVVTTAVEDCYRRAGAPDTSRPRHERMAGRLLVSPPDKRAKLSRQAVRLALLQRTELLSPTGRKVAAWTSVAAVASVEAVLRRRRVAAALRQIMEAELSNIVPVLPARLHRVLDIGCGIALIDALLAERFPDASFDLVDKTERHRSIRYGFGAGDEFYNSLAVAADVVGATGVPVRVWDADHADRIEGPFDLVISLISWGFHYPVGIYLPLVTRELGPGGVAVLDVRLGTNGVEELREHFPNQTELLRDAKRVRLACWR